MLLTPGGCADGDATSDGLRLRDTPAEWLRERDCAELELSQPSTDIRRAIGCEI